MTQEELDELPDAPATPADQLRRRLVRTTNIDLTPAEMEEISAGWGKRQILLNMFRSIEMVNLQLNISLSLKL